MLDNFDRAKVGYDKMDEHNKEVWNNAVEASAKIVDDCNREGPYNAIAAASRIRELKK